MLKDFRAFILRGNLVDLAVAVVIGTAFGAVVTALVKDLVTPLIAAIGGEPDFSGLKFTINGSAFLYGEFLNALFAFLIIAAVIFFLVIKPLNALMDRRKVDTATDATTRACPQCLSDIPTAAARCAFCTSEVPPVPPAPPPAKAA
jgi:large conductance mechanosensitive channel